MNRAHSEEYRKLGLNIAYYRKERGLSQIQLADRIDISITHMARFENDVCDVSLDVLFSFAKKIYLNRQKHGILPILPRTRSIDNSGQAIPFPRQSPPGRPDNR